jgi:hypothetical protein
LGGEEGSEKGTQPTFKDNAENPFEIRLLSVLFPSPSVVKDCVSGKKKEGNYKSH